MCGRYSLTTAPEAIRRLCEVTAPLPNVPPRYNIAPSQDVPVVRPTVEGKGRELTLLRWGLVPHWADSPKIGYRTINARAETVATKPTFRAAFRARRCLIPADGFYEWRKEGTGKQPYRICRPDGEAFALAGLWERWQAPDGEVIESCTIIVTAANDLVRPIHERMPVILDPADFDVWLDGGPAAANAAEALLRPCPSEALTVYPVSPRVNSPRNDDAGLIEPQPEPAQAQQRLLI